MTPRPILITLLVAATAQFAHGYSNALFHEAPTLQKTTPSKTPSVDIELPDFDELFGRFQEVSPLARSVITGCSENNELGFQGIDDTTNLKWKRVESSKGKTVYQIDKIDNFQGHPAPILRFRASIDGPCNGEYFSKFLMDFETRKKWDSQIAESYEIYPINDLDSANIAMGFGRYGDCSRLGIGYCQTKKASVVTAREQLTLCGVQDFPNGSCIIWGTEMEEWHDHLMPPGKRHTRAKSHLFTTTLTPTSDNSFDVEYVLQLEIGGKMPTWLTGPIVTETVKNLFKSVDKFFTAGEGGELDLYLKDKAAQELDHIGGRHSLLMTP